MVHCHCSGHVLTSSDFSCRSASDLEGGSTYHDRALTRWIEQMRVATSEPSNGSNVDDTATPLPFILLHFGNCVLGHLYHTCNVDLHRFRPVRHVHFFCSPSGATDTHDVCHCILIQQKVYVSCTQYNTYRCLIVHILGQQSAQRFDSPQLQ